MAAEAGEYPQLEKRKSVFKTSIWEISIRGFWCLVFALCFSGSYVLYVRQHG
jgi:hypothetical protein